MMDSLAITTGPGFYLELQRQLPGQLTYFITGALGYYYLQYLVKYAVWLAVTVFIFEPWLPLTFVQPLALGVLVLYCACVLPSLGKYGDFSYGIYIVHFPILQVMIAYGLFEKSPWLMLFVSSVIVIVGAVFLWHFIEKLFLAKSSHYVKAINDDS